MRVRKLSSSNDMTFGSGALNFYVDIPAAVAQVVQTSLLLWLGEWYIDVTLGMPWIQGVLGKYNLATADATVQDYISNVQGVTDISSYASVSNQKDRNYSAAATIDTLYGKTAVQIANQSLF